MSYSQTYRPGIKTRIVCTIGPAVCDVETVEQLIEQGMSVVRLNLAHGTHTEHTAYINNVRQAELKSKTPIGILADLPGPKYRLGHLNEPAIALIKDAVFTLKEDDSIGEADSASVRPKGFARDIQVGARILIDEGKVELIAEKLGKEYVQCKIVSPGRIQPRKAVTAPGFTSTLNYFTEETIAALEFVTKADVDFVGLSYVRSAADVHKVRSFLSEQGKNLELISKIELRQATENIEEIMEASDGVMVARGDLGIEMPLAEMPGTQKRIIAATNRIGKPVITATQMLESMIELPRPTRAEATDVHNAIRDGSDAIMLSGETSIGKYPSQAVKFMAEIASHAEQEANYEVVAKRRTQGGAVDDVVAANAVSMADGLRARAIITFTEQGGTAQRVASFRPRTPIVAAVRDKRALRTLTLRWGMHAVHTPPFSRVQEMFWAGSEMAMSLGYAERGDLIVAVVGMPIGIPRNTNLVRVIRVPETKPSAL